MGQLINQKTILALCHIWQGVFLILIMSSVTSLFAKPTVGLLVGINDNNGNIRVVGTSLEEFKSGTIEFEYDSSIDIDDVLLGSPISAIALGASIDRSNHRLRITISATKPVVIDSASIISFEVLVSSVAPFYALTILNASFTNQSGVAQTADIRPTLSVGITWHTFKNKKEFSKPDQFFQLNGRMLSQKTIQNYNRLVSKYTISQRIICK
jgi:hypothetical protein